MRKTLGRLAFLWLPLALALTASPVTAADEPGVILGGLGRGSLPADSIAPAQLQKIQAEISAYEKRKAALGKRDKETVPFLYPYFPQSGMLGRDLYISNFTDQNSLPGTAAIQDWDCSDYTPTTVTRGTTL